MRYSILSNVFSILPYYQTKTKTYCTRSLMRCETNISPNNSVRIYANIYIWRKILNDILSKIS